MASYAGRHRSLDLPRPSRAAAPLVLLALASALFEIDHALPWLVGALGAACFGAAAVVRAVRARLELAAVRRTADRMIVHDSRALEHSELARWRCEELTSAESRTALRLEIERLLSGLDPHALPSASPLRRPAARANEQLLQKLADRLAASRPVCARGVVLAKSLLHDAGSPLYAEDADVLLPPALRRVLGALEE